MSFRARESNTFRDQHGPQLEEIDPGLPTGGKGSEERESSPGPLGAWPPGGASAPRTHLTLVYNLADMIKWQVNGLQVVCLTVLP